MGLVKTCTNCKHYHLDRQFCCVCMSHSQWRPCSPEELITRMTGKSGPSQKLKGSLEGGYVYIDESTFKPKERKEYNTMYKKVYLPMIEDSVKKVIFHDPATIVYWSDGSRTVVKCCEGDVFDPEKGLAMAFAKRVMVDYKQVFKEYIPEEKKCQ